MTDRKRNRVQRPGLTDANKAGMAPKVRPPTGLSAELLATYEGWPARFSSKVRISEACWEWTAAKSRHGYGRYGTQDSRSGWRFAHRWAYETTGLSIPEGHVLDHLCRNPSCVRPDHLEVVTQADNIRRGAQSNDSSGWCRRGRHPWTSENILIEKGGTRRCRPCAAERERAYRPPNGNAQAYWAKKGRS